MKTLKSQLTAGFGSALLALNLAAFAGPLHGQDKIASASTTLAGTIQTIHSTNCFILQTASGKSYHVHFAHHALVLKDGHSVSLAVIGKENAVTVVGQETKSGFFAEKVLETEKR